MSSVGSDWMRRRCLACCIVRVTVFPGRDVCGSVHPSGAALDPAFDCGTGVGVGPVGGAVGCRGDRPVHLRCAVAVCLWDRGWDGGLVGFDRTVLVRFRMRLEASDDPRRIFARTTQIATQAGLIGVKRVLDSAPLFDAVATMDTVTLIRSAIRGG